MLSIPTYDVIETMIEYSKREWFAPTVILLAETGMRVGELCGTTCKWTTKSGETRITGRRGLIIDDVCGFHDGWRAVNTVKLVGKGSKEREIPLSSKARAACEYLAELHCGSGDNTHENLLLPVSQQGVRLAFKEAREAAGIEMRLTPHTMRHFACTRLVKAGYIKEAQMIAGHASSTMTLDIYTHVKMSDLTQAVNAV